MIFVFGESFLVIFFVFKMVLCFFRIHGRNSFRRMLSLSVTAVSVTRGGGEFSCLGFMVYRCTFGIRSGVL